MKKIFATIVLCLTAMMAWADGKPFIKSLTGSISGNTLTLTATMNYDNIESMIKESVQYHWVKGGAPQAGTNNVFTENNALTMEDLVWEVYATYTYQGQQHTTDVVSYTQTPPVVGLSGVVSGDNINLTASFNDYNSNLTGISYNWFTYSYNEEGTPTRVNDPDNHTAAKTVPALRFESEQWFVEAVYTYNGESHTTESADYLLEATALPTLTVAEVEDKEQGHDQLVMNASLSPDYTGKITNLQYHWSLNGVEQTDHYNAHREAAHTFDTQFWRCKATFEYDGKTYETNSETYTYYSTLGQLHFTAALQSDGSVVATLQEAGNLGQDINVAYSWKDSRNHTGNNATYVTRLDNAEWVEFTATITQSGTSNQLIKHAFYSFDGQHTVVYIKYTGGGNDNNDGKTPDTPVATWKKAYSLLNNGGWDQNIIVIVNGTGTGNMTINNEDTGEKAATITGQWPLDKAMDHNTAGIVYVSSSTTNDKTGARIGAPTRFKNVVFYSSKGATGRFSCHLHDVEFDEGVVMKNFPDLQTNSGATSGRKAPDFHMQLYADQYNNATFPQAKDKVMQVTIKSGQFGRILASRIAGTKAISTYVIGRHDNPLKANITVDIQDFANNRKAGGKEYTDDIAYLAAGLTQGMMWGDFTMNIKRGRVATLVAGSQGNALSMGSLKVPVSTYCGRTVINVMAADNNEVEIQNYYGGCQGRVYNDNDPLICDAYFYGHSTLNVMGGTIKSDIFASSAGISGLRSDDPDYYAKKQYTSDKFIPYPGTFAYGIDYLPYDRNKQIVTMTTHNGTIDLNETEIKMNISGGVVNNVYGGSYGYSDVLPAKVAPAHAGRLFGNTSVNISGGTVTGSVYAGGKGSTQYYTDAVAAKKADFSDVAQVYGNTNVTITGTPDIRGNIYGGGAGVDATSQEQFLEIARVYGNTNVIFDADYTDDNPFRGNIYGGGAKGGVQGNTNVIIRKGVILGNVFGGSQGQEGYSDKAKVVGTTKVVIGE